MRARSYLQQLVRLVHRLLRWLLEDAWPVAIVVALILLMVATTLLLMGAWLAYLHCVKLS